MYQQLSPEALALFRYLPGLVRHLTSPSIPYRQHIHTEYTCCQDKVWLCWVTVIAFGQYNNQKKTLDKFLSVGKMNGNIFSGKKTSALDTVLQSARNFAKISQSINQSIKG
jgi:hypothetical protein